MTPTFSQYFAERAAGLEIHQVLKTGSVNATPLKPAQLIATGKAQTTSNRSDQFAMHVVTHGVEVPNLGHTKDLGLVCEYLNVTNQEHHVLTGCKLG